jgi:hypothetical protein
VAPRQRSLWKRLGIFFAKLVPYCTEIGRGLRLAGAVAELEALTVAMRINNPDRSPLRING